MNKQAWINVLLIFSALCLFIEISALVSLKAIAVYLFGGAAIVFALLALMVVFLD